MGIYRFPVMIAVGTYYYTANPRPKRKMRELYNMLLK